MGLDVKNTAVLKNLPMGAAPFLDYLLREKYSVSQEELQTELEKTGIFTLFSEFRSNFSEEELNSWIQRIESSLPLTDSLPKDVVFGLLYSSECFKKLMRAKSISSNRVTELYQTQLQINKKYIINFNKKDKVTKTTEKQIETCTRFPPEPSGFLHIGHAKAALLNKDMAGSGRLIVRMDDTNPKKESMIYERAILEDLEMLKITDYKLTRSSDYFDQLYGYALELIKRGRAYVDNTEREKMQMERTNGIASANRDLEPETSLKIFEEMKDGKHPEYCLRAKISVDDPNKAMRDPVIYRTSTVSHHTTGTRYKIYPTYDFTVPLVDSLEGVTLTLRTNEYRDRNALYFWVLDALDIKKKPKIMDFSRLCFENTVISKRKLKFYVDNNFVDGWDDPRFPTLRGLRRQGLHPDALIEYIRLQGASQKTAVNSWDKIWAINKKTIDPLSPRLSAIPFEDCVFCRVKGLEREMEAEILFHRKNPGLGKKRVLYSSEILMSQEDGRSLEEGEEFTLMNWGNAVLERKTIEDGRVIEMGIRLHLDGDFKLTKNKVNWIATRGSTLVKVCEYGALQNELDTEDLERRFNRESKRESWWLAESAVHGIESGSYIQCERVGFFFCDGLLVFNLIPFTKQKRTR